MNNWVAGWSKRIQVTISGSLIEEDMNDFPFMIKFDATSSGIFDELGDNSKKIAIYDNNNEECPVEIEYWSQANTEAVLWTKAPTLTSGTSKSFYVYYDSLHHDNPMVGDTGDDAATKVWDSNFIGVWHLGESSGSALDSLGDNNGTFYGDLPDAKDGIIRKGQDFDGSGDYISVGDIENTHITIEFNINLDSQGTNGGVVQKYNTSDKSYMIYEGGGSLTFAASNNGSTDNNLVAVVVSAGTPYTIAAKWDGTTAKMYVNGGEEDSAGYTAGIHNSSYPIEFGRWRDSSGEYIDGVVDEIRLSTIARSSAWIKTTYYSNWNQLLSYGQEELLTSQTEEAGVNYVELVIPSYKIDNDLNDFPVLVHLSSDSGIDNQDVTEIFDALESDANKNKIFFTQDKKSQLFVEREDWSHTNQEAWLWIKVPELSSTSDNVIYLYYDKNYSDNTEFVGAIDSIAGRNVWDANFVRIYHLASNPTTGIVDSLNNGDATVGGSLDASDLVSSKLFKGYDLDRSSEDYFEVDDDSDLYLVTFTLEAIYKPSDVSNNQIIIERREVGYGDQRSTYVLQSRETAGQIWFYYGNGSGSESYQPNYSFSLNTDYYLAVRHSSNWSDVFVNGEKQGSGTSTSTNPYNTSNSVTVIGHSDYYSGFAVDGLIDEVRISNVARSDAWIKATYNSNWDELVYYEPKSVWLSDWARRIKITIDSDKIDESLVDFPILIALSSGTGINNADTTALFDDYTYSNGINWQDHQLAINLGAEGTYDTDETYTNSVVISGSKYQMWYSGDNGSNARIIYCDSDDGISWYNHQMVVNIGAEGTYDTIHAYRPMVMLDDDGKYKMWYSGNDSSYIRIIYCDSNDGKNWSNHQLVVDRNSEGTYDQNNCLSPKVTKDGSTYRMYYGGYTSGVGQYYVIYCDSTDCINWSNFQMVIPPSSEGTWDTKHVFPSNIIKDGSTYKMWYSASESINLYSILHCTSTDAKNWSNFERLIKPNTEGIYDTDDAYAAHVVDDSGTLKMWYTAGDGSTDRILYAVSDDSIDNAKKIAITDDTGIKQLYGEIESFNGLDEKAFIWTKVPYVSSYEDTIIYLYYDISKSDNSSYIGEIGDAAAQNVWDDDFVAVYHLNQDPSAGNNCILDSTSYGHHGTPHTSMTSSDLTNGKIDGGIDFDGSNDEIVVGDNSDLNPNNYTIEGIFEGHLTSTTHRIASKVQSGGANPGWSLQVAADEKVGIAHQDGTGTSNVVYSTASYTSGLHYAVATFETGVGSKLFVDGSYEDLADDTTSDASSSHDFIIGMRDYTSGWFDGILDEIRYSKLPRSNAWIKATYYSNWNNLSSFAEETQPLYYYDGYVKEQGNPVARTVRLYRRYNGELVSQTVSSSTTGYYYLTTTYNEQHFVVAFDDDLGEAYNAIIYDKVDPEGTI